MPTRPRKQSPSHPPSPGPALGEAEVLSLAKRVTDVTGCPVIGGIAVILHGGPRATRDIDIYSENLWETHTKLEAAGMLWQGSQKQHLIDGVPIHMVPAETFGGVPKRLSTIRGVKAIGLADLIRSKLTLGVKGIRRSRDITHVLDLIEAIPLKRDYAAKLPTALRGAFKHLVDEVHEPRRTSPSAFYARYSPPASSPARK